jgi:hypothetical protein
MSLNFAELGYFIDQLTRASEFYGFSDADAHTLNTRMNSMYNVRCAPAITFNAQQGPQLLSLCQDPSCPLAVPNSDCGAYANLTADGAAPGASSVTGIAPSSTSSTESNSDPAGPSSSTKGGLSAGAVIGVTIGIAATISFIAAVLFHVHRKRHIKRAQQQTQQRLAGSESLVSSQGQGHLSPQSEQFNAFSPHSHNSYNSQAQTSYGPAELDSPKSPPGPPVELSGETAGAEKKQTSEELSQDGLVARMQ